MLCNLSSPHVSSSNESVLSVAVATYYFPPLYGGMETQLLLLCRFLASSACKVSVYTSLPDGAALDEEMLGFRVKRYGSSKTQSGLQNAYWDMHREICKSIDEYDLLYMPLGVGPKYPLHEQLEVLSLFIRQGKPAVLRVTSSGRISELAHSAPFALPRLREASKIVALNDGIEKELQAVGVHRDAVFNVTNGVDVQLFIPRSEEQNGSSECNPTARFICPCRVCEKKELHVLVADWSRLMAGAGGLVTPELVIVGDDNQGTEDERLYSNLREGCRSPVNGITLLPSRNYWDMPAIYRAADVFVCYSMQEGMSNSALEAMSCGLPVVVPSTEAFQSLVQDSPNFTFTGDSDRFEALTRALRERARWKEIGVFNRQRIVDGFSAETILAKYFDLFRYLAKSANCQGTCGQPEKSK